MDKKLYLINKMLGLMPGNPYAYLFYEALAFKYKYGK